jgi:oligopeptide/dipeptide ABC transporter ATP-binding protein
MTATPLLEVEGLDVVYENGLHAVRAASLSVAAGETLGLVGESGCGKSSLVRAIVGLQRPAAGRIAVAGRDLGRIDRAGRRWLSRQVQMIFQDPLSSLSPRLTIAALLGEPLRIHGLARAEHWPRVLGLAASLGLAEGLLAKYPHQVSGGQARRVGIARALVLQPRLLIADEPTAGLDVSIQGDLLNLMAELQARLGLAYLVVSHNLGVIRRVTDRIAIMYLGRIVETGPTPRIFARPAHPYTAGLIAASPVIDPLKQRPRSVLRGEIPSPFDPPSGCAFRTRCPRAAERCAAEAPALADRGGGRVAACHFPLD